MAEGAKQYRVFHKQETRLRTWKSQHKRDGKKQREQGERGEKRRKGRVLDKMPFCLFSPLFVASLFQQRSR